MKTKNRSLNQGQESTEMEEVRHSFAQWRMTRSQIGPIPKELWKAAVDLCKHHPPSKVSQVLHLNYTDLRKRVERVIPEVLSVRKRTTTTKNSMVTPSATFVDISPLGNSSLPGSMPECSMEIRERDGFSLKMQCRGEPGVDLVEICRIVIGSR